MSEGREPQQGQVIRDAERTFGERTLRLTLRLSRDVPDEGGVGTVHCIGFDVDGRVLLVEHVERDWTIPGGHLEPGESPEAALHREVLEEAAATIADPLLFAHERIERLAGEADPRYANPSHQLFYVARVTDVGVLVANAECRSSRLFPIDEARRLPGWLDHNQELFEAALVLARTELPQGL